jgi:hypothetical protein
MCIQQPTPRVTAARSAIGRASGFELTSPSQPGAANIAAALERNRAFAAAGGHQSAVVFPNLRLFVITCLDPSVDPTSSASAPHPLSPRASPPPGTSTTSSPA